MALTTAAPAPTSTSPLETRTAIEPGTKRLLLLEDDPSLREVIKDFLSETGYTVVEAETGVDGIREILAGDFAIILCDMLMPALPGDLFYRAVERAKPHLCDRFIFMTGHRGDSETNTFIKETGGHALLKPFGLQQLLNAIGEMERRRTLRQTSPVRSNTTVRPARSWASDAPAEKPGTAPAASPTPAKSAKRPAPVAGTTGEHVGGGFTWANVTLPLAFVSMAALLYFWHDRASFLSADASRELRELQAAKLVVVESLEEAREEGTQSRKLAERATKIQTDWEQLKWSTALQRILVCATDEIQLRGVRIRREGIGNIAGNSWSLRIAAHYAGDPANVDTFRLRVKEELEKIFGGVVDTQFAETEDRAADVRKSSDERKFTFTILASLGSLDRAPTKTRAKLRP